MSEKLYIIEDISDFYPLHVFECGQCFRWNREADGSYSGIAGSRAANVRFEPGDEEAPAAGGRLIIREAESFSKGGAGRSLKTNGESFSESGGEAFWRHYFDLDRDYGKIKRKLICGDQVMKKAVSYGWGIRILNQELWETILSFIISQNNNIPRIKGCIEKLAVLCGDPAAEIRENPAAEIGEKPAAKMTGKAMAKMTGKTAEETRAKSAAAEAKEPETEAAGRKILYSLPGPEKLASMTAEELAPVKLGYRAGYLIKTAQCVCENGLPADSESLRQLCGVGPKVADCISLFGMGRCESFPVDVWVARVMHRLYGLDEKNRKAISEFARNKFGSLGGFAQQYLFYYMRENN